MSRPFTSRRFQEPAVLIRQEAGERVRGRFVPGDETRTDISVVSAPPDAAKMRDLMPEGTRISGSRTFWIEGVEVRLTTTGADPAEADVIEYRGESYTVHHVEEWPGFVEVLGIREEGQ